MARKLNSECQIMVFRPTMEEFSDFSRYIKYMESQGAHRGGVAKVIPPKEWSPCKGYDNIDNLAIPAPISQVVTGQKGLFTQYNIQQKPMTVKEMRRLSNTDRYAVPFHESYEDLERTYWKNITFNPAIYGADISGSLYDKDVNEWNVARLDTILDLIENDTGVKIEGVNTAYLYFGMWKTSFAWHTEDMDLYSINYVHFGAPKSWYSVPPEHGKRLERLATGFFPNSNSTCSAFLRHKMTLISPSVLRQYGIPFNKITQEAGEFMITFPYGYHSGFNHGFNCAESTNFASERWIKYGMAAEKCACRKDMVFINMDLFVKSFLPEKYEQYKKNKCNVKLTYTDVPTPPDFSKKPTHWRTRLEEIRKAYQSSLVASSLPSTDAKDNAESKKARKIPEMTKVPRVKLVKANFPPTVTCPSTAIARSPTKTTSPHQRFARLSPNCASNGTSAQSPFAIKMGAVLPLSSLPVQIDDMYEEGTSGRCMTLMDRIKMGKRNPSQQPAAGKTDADGESRPPPSKDHDAYVKKTNAKQAYLPLPVRMKVSCNNLSGWKGLAAESNGKGVTRVEEMCRWKVPGPTETVSREVPKAAEKTNPAKIRVPRPPLKRRHPVSKKGPSKKSSPAVVLKNPGPDSDSSDADEARTIADSPHANVAAHDSKNEIAAEQEGYPSLWPRMKSSFKTERHYNATVAKLPPHCAVCSLFRPYYQKSFKPDAPTPPLSELLQKKGLRAGCKSKPIIPETIFATSTDHPAPLAKCELLDDHDESHLIQCEICKVQVHASCYGIAKPDSGWNCDRCSFKAWIAQCCLCSLRGGVLKPVNNGQQWAHTLCAIAIPEVSFDDIPRRNGINVKNICRTRQKLKCTYCRKHKHQKWQNLGSCIQCCAGSCATSFHPTCALAAGIKMEPGDWPLPVFVYCQRHSLQREKTMMNDRNSLDLPELTVGQTVYGRHKNGRYYACVVKGEKAQAFHHVLFRDSSWSENLYEQDIVSHDFASEPPKVGDTVTVKWTDGRTYDGEYVGGKRHHMLTVEFEDRSVVTVKREDAYADADEMPKRIKRKLSTATFMSKSDFLSSPQKGSDESSAGRRAAFHASKLKMEFGLIEESAEL